MLIKPKYVTFTQAKLLKQKGFNVETLSQFDKDGNINTYENYDSVTWDWNAYKELLPVKGGHPFYSRPEQWTVIEWFDMFNIQVSAFKHDNYWCYGIQTHNKNEAVSNLHDKCTSRAEAISKAIDFVLNNLNLIRESE